MASAKVLTWACFLFLATAICAEGLGVNWGTQSAQNLHPSQIVQMLKDNKINKIKLFESDHWTVKYFANTGIEVMLGIPNNELSRLNDYDNAKDFVKNNVTTHLDKGGVDIKYVAVGNEPFLKAYNGTFLKTTFPALQNVQKALNEAGVGNKIKATIPQNADVYDSGSQGPSSGNFRADIRDTMVKIVKFLKDNKAPFLVNIYPFLSLYENADFPVEFAFFDGNAKAIQDKNIQYSTMFDANLDTLVWSLRKAGCPDLEIIVGEIGWPTDGNINANPAMAKKFYNGLMKRLASKKGTPLHPGPIEVYLFSLLDENLKSVAPGDFEKNWGIFRYDGQPKFPVDFTGNGQDKMPIGAKNIQYLEKKWCVLNDLSGKDIKQAGFQVQYACERSDCTKLRYGGTCNKLDLKGNISYAFNMHFQMQNQDVETCTFDGFGKIVDKNLSTSTCLFPIALESSGRRLSIGIILSVISGLLSSLVLF